MSAFLVDKKTISRILTILSIQLRDDGYLVEQMKEMTGVTYEELGWKDKLGTLMLNMNQMALGERYGDKMERHSYKYYCPEIGNPIQYLKSLQCFNYQCSEGNIINLSLYKFFDEVFVTKLMKSIIYAMPQYDQAEWA